MAVQRACHKLLSGARLAREQDGGAGLRQPADGAEDLLHGRRLSEDLGLLGDGLQRRLLPLALLERAANQFHGLVDVEGLGQVLVGAALERGHRGLQVRVGRHHDDRHRRELLLHHLQQFDARRPGHADVGNQNLRRLAAVETLIEKSPFDYERHMRWARFTYPIWYYVSVTGVLVYFFLYVWWPKR